MNNIGVAALLFFKPQMWEYGFALLRLPLRYGVFRNFCAKNGSLFRSRQSVDKVSFKFLRSAALFLLRSPHCFARGCFV